MARKLFNISVEENHEKYLKLIDNAFKKINSEECKIGQVHKEMTMRHIDKIRKS